jgi:catechol 2,3-dioxygenase-like lactoylglutathione lyase family enzyme
MATQFGVVEFCELSLVRMSPKLAGVLETVVYCTRENEEATRRFYRDVLGLRPFSDTSAGHRIGPGVLLVFNRDESAVQDWPPPHGAVGPVHTCFLATPGETSRGRSTSRALG